MRSILYPASVLQKTTRILLGSLLWVVTAYSQPSENPLSDSLKKNLAQAHTDRDKNFSLLDLADYYSSVNNDLSEQYARQAMQVAELSRDRKLIINTYHQNGKRYLYHAQLSNYLQLALDNFQQAAKMAEQNNLDDELAYSYTGLARCYRQQGAFDKALNYNNLALSIAGAGNNDSLKISAYIAMGNTYIARNEKLLAFRNYLEALDVAERSKKESLLQIAYSKLSVFYDRIGEYDKAIDYAMLTLGIDERNRDRYKLLDDYNTVGDLFTGKKQYDLALKMYENAISLADSLQYTIYKTRCYLNITNMYFDGEQLSKGFDYLKSHPTVLDFFNSNGLDFFLDEGYAGIYSEMGKYDSAAYYFKKAEQPMLQKAGNAGQYGFYTQYGRYYRKTGNYPQAIACFIKTRQIGLNMSDLNMLQNSAEYLDTLYTLQGDYKNAYYYNGLGNQYRDSIRALAKESDLLKLEVDSDNKRRERLAKEEEEKTNHRHNVQYMGITTGIVSLFIVMVMMGFFVVSPRTIRALGFFSFIFLFEFIILLADKQIHEWTHGEPWKILIIKIALAAILLPLHHWLEHKVIHYLTTRKKLVPNSVFRLGRLKKKATPLAE